MDEVIGTHRQDLNLRPLGYEDSATANNRFRNLRHEPAEHAYAGLDFAR